MKISKLFFSVLLGFIWASSSQAFSVWVVESGQDPFSNSQDTLAVFPGTTTLDLYYDAEMGTSFGYDILLEILGTASISNVGGGDSGLGNVAGTGWRQLGGDPINGETDTLLGFSFDFTGEFGSSVSVSGTYTDENFTDARITPSTLAVSQVPVPAAVWLFGTAIIGLTGFNRRNNSKS